MAWGTITVSQRLVTMNKGSITCDYRNCNHKFKIGETALRQQRRAHNRYFCPECAKKLRV